MKWLVDVLAMGAMKGFGLGLTLSVLISVATTSLITEEALLENPMVLIFTILGLALAFEDATSATAPSVAKTT